MTRGRILVVGAGVGGLAAAARLAAQGCDVTCLERADAAGGKMRAVEVGGVAVDAGPTVLTMRDVFDDLFAACGADFAAAVRLEPLSVLARHAWSGGAMLDLFADLDASADAIGAFAGPRDAAGFRDFQRDAARVFRTLDAPFLRRTLTNPVGLTFRVGLHRLADMFAIRPFDTLWGALGGYFRDPRLKQLFGRYATYCGASPFAAPATLMLIAHVEQAGVWRVAGGMRALAQALADLVVRAGGRVRTGAEVRDVRVGARGVEGVTLASGERLDADAVIFAGDASALRTGLLGADVRRAGPPPRPRSLSAVTFLLKGRAAGWPLAHHNVAFSDDYAAEFTDILERRRLPRQPTIYLCAQDRDESHTPAGAERMLALVNAPAIGADLSETEIAACATTTMQRLATLGLTLEPEAMTTVGPPHFAQLFPGSAGALYGAATHGWAAAFQRPSARTRIPGLYLAGGSVHPGAGVPMAALSGQIAAATLMADRASTRTFRPAATPGGTSTRSATTAPAR